MKETSSLLYTGGDGGLNKHHIQVGKAGVCNVCEIPRPRSAHGPTQSSHLGFYSWGLGENQSLKYHITQTVDLSIETENLPAQQTRTVFL